MVVDEVGAVALLLPPLFAEEEVFELEVSGTFTPLSDFRLGKLTGCGARRALGTLPRLCMPCLGATVLVCGSIELP